MSDRHEQARDAAERQLHVYGDDFKARTLRANLNDAFVQGVEWADANPKPHTITRAELGAAADEFTAAGTTGEWVSIEGILIEALSALGIEVRDE